MMLNGGTYKQRSQWLLTGHGPWVITRITLPMLPGVLALLLLDFVDSLLVSEMGTHSMAALGFSIPITNTLFGVIVGFSIGLVCIITKGVATHSCRQIKKNMIIVLLASAIIGLAISGVGLLTLEHTLGMLGARLDQNSLNVWLPIRDTAHEFLVIRYFGFTSWMLSFMCIAVFRALGHMQLAATVFCMWSILTLGLDYFFVRINPVNPEFGLQGIAWGHLISDSFIAVLLIILIVIKERLSLKILTDKALHILPVIRSFLRQSLPAIAYSSIIAMSAVWVTVLASCGGAKAVATFSIINRLEPLILVVPMALTMSIPVFAGHNWSAGLFKRTQKNILTSLQFIVFFQMALYILLVILFGDWGYWFGTTVPTDPLLSLYLFIVPVSYGALGVSMVATSALNALGYSNQALLLNAERVMVCYLPCTFLGYWLAGPSGILLGMCIGNILAGIFAHRRLGLIMNSKKNVLLSQSIQSYPLNRGSI